MRARYLIQITDLHLLGDPEGRLYGWRNQAAFDLVLAHALAHCPRADALLLSGDLVDDESPTGYTRLDRQMAACGLPTYALPGNHDDPQAMARLFTHIRSPAHVDGPVALGPWRLHLLDSHWPGSEAGRLGPDQLARLTAALEANAGAPSVIGVHHPAAPVGSAWMDSMVLREGDALLALAARHRVAALVCGHVHHATDAVAGGVRQLTTPAVTRQFVPASATMGEDTRRPPGYRLLGLHRDGRLTTRVRRVTAAWAARDSR